MYVCVCDNLYHIMIFGKIGTLSTIGKHFVPQKFLIILHICRVSHFYQGYICVLSYKYLPTLIKERKFYKIFLHENYLIEIYTANIWAQCGLKENILTRKFLT